MQNSLEKKEDGVGEKHEGTEEVWEEPLEWSKKLIKKKGEGVMQKLQKTEGVKRGVG